MKLQRLIGAICAVFVLCAPARATEQSSYVTPSAGPMSMATFVGTYLNPALRALAACHNGSSAPANGPSTAPMAYQVWCDTTANPSVVKMFDGTSWAVVGKLNTSTHVYTPSYQGTDITSIATVAPGGGIATWLAAPSSANLRAALTDEVGTGAAYFQGGDLGTPSAGVATNLTGTASGLTAGNVTTNANLSGDVSSVGNVTTIGATKVVNSMLAAMAANTTKCNATGGSAVPTDCTASTMRTNMGIVIGTNVQAWDADLDALAALSGTNTIYYRSASNTWTAATFGASMGFSGGAITRAALTGDVTASADSNTTVLGNIPSGVTMAGSLLATAIAAPSTPAAGKASVYVDSTSKNFAAKNDAGTVNHGIQTRTATANNWIRSVADDGSTTISQPAFTDISGSVAATQMPAFAGDVTTSAGAVATTIGATKVTSAMLNSDVFSTAHSWGGVQTFTNPIVGTQSPGDNSTKGASTAYADAIAALKANLASPSFTGTVDVTQALKLSGLITPTQITATTNDYAPTGFSTASTLRISTDASRSITGLAGGADGRIIIVHNVGSFDTVLKNQDAGSSAANRFLFGGDMTLAADTSVTLRYDGTSTKWRAATSPGAGGGGGGGITSVACAEGALCPTITTTGTVKTAFSRHFMLGGM